MEESLLSIFLITGIPVTGRVCVNLQILCITASILRKCFRLKKSGSCSSGSAFWGQTICSPLTILLILLFFEQRQLHALKNIFSSLNASPPCPSCSEPNVLDDSQGLAAEGSLSRYSVYPACMSVSVLGTICSLYSLSSSFIHSWFSLSIPVPCSSLMIQPASQRCSNPTSVLSSDCYQPLLVNQLKS